MGESKVKASDIDELDAGWDEEDEQEDEQGDIDAGWGDPDAFDEPEEVDDAASRRLTPEEREARAARIAARKQRLRAKATAKAERRKARVSLAAAKQKKSTPRSARTPAARMSTKSPGRRAGEKAIESRASSPEAPPPTLDRGSTEAFASSRTKSRNLAMVAVLLVIVVGGATLFWLRR